MGNEQKNGRTLDPRTLVVKKGGDLERTDRSAPDLLETERQIREYSDQISAIIQQNTAALAEVFRNAEPFVGRKDFRMQVEEETNVIVRS